jgi:recombination protein RecT
MSTPANNSEKVITTKELFSQDSIRKKFQDLLGKKAQGFITSVLQIVASSELLKQADPNSIYNAAAVAATLDLPLNNSLGFAYIVPYNTRVGDEHIVLAQFQMGYKGFIQLGQRTGLYKNIAATHILEGQLIEENPLTGFKFDFTKKLGEGQADKIIGYASYFQLVNGFEKVFYMTIDQLQRHGKKYSKSYSNAKSLWQTDPASMFMKTVLKLNISKYGPMSIDLQKAVIADQAVIQDADTMDVKYIDNEEAPVDKESERILILIKDAATIEDLDKLEEYIKTEEQNDAWLAKREKLTIKG